MTPELKQAIEEAKQYRDIQFDNQTLSEEAKISIENYKHALDLAIAENEKLENIIYRARRDIEKHNGDWVEEILKEAGEKLMESKTALDKLEESK
jgi:urease accessory protein UreH